MGHNRLAHWHKLEVANEMFSTKILKSTWKPFLVISTLTSNQLWHGEFSLTPCFQVERDKNLYFIIMVQYQPQLKCDLIVTRVYDSGKRPSFSLMKYSLTNSRVTCFQHTRHSRSHVLKSLGSMLEESKIDALWHMLWIKTNVSY